MTLGQDHANTRRRTELRPPGELLMLTNSRWPSGPGTVLQDRQPKPHASASPNTQAPFRHLARLQDHFSEVLEAGHGRLRRNSDRMEDAVVEASRLGRRILHHELAVLGFGPGTGSTCMTGRRLRDGARSAPNGLSFADQPNAHKLVTALHEAGQAEGILRQNVLDESRRCALLRAEVAGEMDLMATKHQQWLDFFGLALQIVDGHQRHEVTQMLSILQARREDLDSTAMVARQHVLSQIEQNESRHRIELQNRQAALADDLDRQKSETKAMMASRQMALNERAESHSFELGRARIDLEERRNDHNFVTSLIGTAVQVFTAGLRL